MYLRPSALLTVGAISLITRHDTTNGKRADSTALNTSGSDKQLTSGIGSPVGHRYPERCPSTRAFARIVLKRHISNTLRLATPGPRHMSWLTVAFSMLKGWWVYHLGRLPAYTTFPIIRTIQQQATPFFLSPYFLISLRLSEVTFAQGLLVSRFKQL